ncbi:hypothetical protein GQ53DRAFT_822489 [Thozetella sp. PMI_491]|nr:hypothetical protein GQ53DRAFT_822489 [Thozetella sp. PMI_491]
MGGADGTPVTTVTLEGTPSISTRPLFNSKGSATAITWDVIVPTPTTKTIFDMTGAPMTTFVTMAMPSPKPTGPISPSAQAAYRSLTERDFLMASFLPVLLSTLLSIFITTFCTDVRRMLPFKALGKQNGATAQVSLCLSRRGVFSLRTPVRFLRHFRDPFPLLNTLLAVSAAVLVPLSSETIKLEIKSLSCSSVGACPVGLRKSIAPSRAAESLLGFMAAIVLVMGIMLFRWRSGVASEPWSIACITSLLPSQDVRDLLLSLPPLPGKAGIRDSQMLKCLEGVRFRIGYPGGYQDDNSPGYGIRTVQLEDEGNIRLTTRNLSPKSPIKKRQMNRIRSLLHQLTPQRQEVIMRCVLLLILWGLLVLLLYYENTILNTPFEAFMDSQMFGIRFLFAAIGTIITSLWEYCFSTVAEYQYYRRLSAGPEPAERSILLSPPVTVFHGIVQAIWTKDWFSANVAFAALLAKFTPLLLSNVPFRNTVTWKMHESCTWIAIVIVTYMIMVLVVVLCVKPPYMPARADTLAGCMYYVCDSQLVTDFEYLSTIRPKERDRIVAQMRRRYTLRTLDGISGSKRFGIGYATD